MKTIKKWLIQLRNWVAELINYYIVEPACDLYMGKIRWILHTVALSLVTLAIAYLSAYNLLTQWFVKQQVITVAPFTFVRTAFAKEESDLPKSTQDKIRLAFGIHADTFLKIAMAESGQQSGNKGYNCYYGKESMACKPEDRKKAWSVDCGLLMINVHGTICPTELFDIDLNIKAGQGKFERQGYGAWTVCRKKIKCK